MRLFGGDLLQQDRELIKALMEAEQRIDKDKLMIDERRAQCYTCFARDWFDIGFEEEGAALLLKAEKTYPGYFKEKLGEHMKANPDFTYLILDMTARLLIDFNEIIKTAGTK